MSRSSPATPAPEFRLEPFSYAEAAAIARELAIAEPVAVALVRRGYRSVEAARAFLAADEAHDPSEFEGIGDAVAAIRAAVAASAPITVHGDYDVDGVTSTAILVATLRELGAECDWLIPDRADDGYGLTTATIERLAARGTRLLITADCGITSAAEVRIARERGIETVVTDHHQPGDELPDCPIVHPVLSNYPCPDLCAAGVAHKLAAALVGVERAERDLDLVALATVADMVPLLGENRSLVRRGLVAARRGGRPGLRALMAAASVLPERLEEADLAFRLAPRINAAGRLYRADAAVELLLTDDPARATQIARELDQANHERREAEREVLADAERRLRELGPEGAEAKAIVLWGEGWHPGVVGICASRMAERHLKPTVLIGLDERGRGRGSGRSVPGFDLLACLRACGGALARFGGHRAAAGLEIAHPQLDRFRQEFWRHAANALGDREPVRSEEVDAIVGGESLGHEVAAQFARLGPFGKGNPGVRLLVPSARITDVRPMGEGDRHARFSIASGPARASGVAFGVGGALATTAASGPLDVSLRLELNEWNGAIEPRVVLGELYRVEHQAEGGAWRCDEGEHHARLAAELARDAPSDPVAAGLAPARERVERTAGSGVAAVAHLASSGEPVLVVCADALWRRSLVECAVRPDRFGAGAGAVVASRGSIAAGVTAVKRLLETGRGGVALADWPALALEPALAAGFPHVMLADPAPASQVETTVLAGPGYLHLLASHSDPALSLRALDLSLPLRATLGGAYRDLRQAAAPAGALDAAAVRAAVCGPRGDGRSPEACARMLRVLTEIGVVRITGNGPDLRLEVVSSGRGELDRSASYVAYRTAHEECVRFLTKGKKQKSSPLQAAA